jgi:hypothetical protein
LRYRRSAPREVNVSKHDDPVSDVRPGRDPETPPPPLGLDAFDPIDEDDELVEDLRTVRMRAPQRRTIQSDIPDSVGVDATDVPEPGFDPEPGLDTEPIERPHAPVHEVAPPPREASILDRAVRPKSAIDAAREAAEREASAGRVISTAARGSEPAGADAVRAAIARDLGGAGQIFVLETHEVSAGPLARARPGTLDREILKALWRGHRAKFLSDGNLERGATATIVVQALEQKGSLAVARVVARGRDHLAFVDVDSRRVIACLADAYALAAAASVHAAKH